jgi:hypothetical protein
MSSAPLRVAAIPEVLQKILGAYPATSTTREYAATNKKPSILFEDERVERFAVPPQFAGRVSHRRTQHPDGSPAIAQISISRAYQGLAITG